MVKRSATRWIIGRSRESDVVVAATGVAAKHCELWYERGSWFIVAIDASAGIGVGDRGSIQWSRERIQISATDSVWLTDDVKLPWPSDDEALACLTVGRAIDSDIILPNSRISGRHALLIAGQNGTWVLCDSGSRNGLFIDEDLEHRITAVMLLPGRSVFLGSERIDVNALVARAKTACPTNISPSRQQPRPAEEIDESSPPSKVEATSRKSSTTAVKAALTALIPCVAAVSAWWMLMRPTTDVGTVEQRIPYRDPAPTLASRVTESPEVEPEPPDVQPEPPVSDAMVEQSPRNDSVYWVLVRHNEYGNYFRLGSAVAVSADMLLSTASVVTAIEGMAGDGFSDPSIAQVTTGRISKITSQHVFSEFVKRTQTANAMLAQYEELVSELDEDPIKMAESRDELNKKAELVNLAMAATAAVDVGWLKTEPVPAFLNVDPSVKYHASQSLTGLAAGFDAADPYFVAASSSTPSTWDMRVTSVGPELGGMAGVVALKKAGPWSGDQNLIGSPLVSDDRVIGIIVFQDSESETIEAVTASVIAKALFNNEP